MNFFDHQEEARRSTRKLVGLFVLAVFLIVLSVYLAVALAATWAENLDVDVWNLSAFGWVAAVTLTVIVVGSLYKIATLRSGGQAVGRLLGGRPLQPNTRDLKERRLLNVVEEMALASGMAVPTVYVLDQEKGINAFAAGFGPGDTVIGVTRGCLDLLSRDELQGVIGHEFSHALNGDMRLNLRLMGLLHGILVIAMIGYWILRTTSSGSSSSSSSSSSSKKGGGGGIAFLGLAFLVIGGIGVFFGRLIKSAVSRQREFLGDAAAVQFTRNPDSIAGALKKIGGLAAGSRITNSHAEEASHFFFGNGMGKGFSAKLDSMLATHPPLVDRIKRIEPRFDGELPKVDAGAVSQAQQLAAKEEEAGGFVPGFAPRAAALAPAAPPEAAVAPAAEPPPRTVDVDPATIAASVGTLDQAHLELASTFLARLPPTLRGAARDPSGACAIVFGLLLDRDRSLRGRQLDELQEAVDAPIHAETVKLTPALDQCPVEARLPLVDLALPALRRLSEPQYRVFRAAVERLIAADAKLSLFEFTLQRILLRHLEPHFHAARPPAVAYGTLRAVSRQASLLLSILAHAGQAQAERAAEAFAAGARQLADTRAVASLLPFEQCGLADLDRALAALVQAAPAMKRKLLEACAATIAFDKRVTIQEGELLRAISDSLDCPMPPFLPGQALA
jgi:Zn-dependent protease with chaperone function